MIYLSVLYLTFLCHFQEPYPAVKVAINAQLNGIRALGGCVQRPLVSAVIRAHIAHGAPQLFENGFKLSDTWVHNYIAQELNWTMRKSTQATRKVPANANELCRAMLAWITFAVNFYRIHPDMIVNADQTGISLFPTGKYTYEMKGSKDVSIVGHDEKRQHQGNFFGRLESVAEHRIT